jgi:hypothetical protein
MLRAFSLTSPLPWALLLGACFAASCSDRGATSICPPLPLYEGYPLGDASLAGASSADSSEARAALAAAVDAGCATAPTHFLNDGGAAGAASEGARAGSGGTASETAGAAGSD